MTGGVKLTLACALPGTAVTFVGLPGVVLGVTLGDGFDAGPEPRALVATTVKVYAVPFVSPVITCDVDVVPAAVSTPPAGLDVTV